VRKQSWQQWARLVAKDPTSPSKLRGIGALAPLTGTDCRALDAFVECLKLYAYNSSERALMAARLVLFEMQDSTRWIARELIPFVLDWGDRERLWPLVNCDTPAEAAHREMVLSEQAMPEAFLR